MLSIGARPIAGNCPGKMPTRTRLGPGDGGLGYKKVTWKLQSQVAMGTMNTETMERIVKALFPIHPQRKNTKESIELEEILSFTERELATAIRSLQNKKAPKDTRRLLFLFIWE